MYHGIPTVARESISSQSFIMVFCGCENLHSAFIPRKHQDSRQVRTGLASLSTSPTHCKWSTMRTRYTTRHVSYELICVLVHLIITWQICGNSVAIRWQLGSQRKHKVLHSVNFTRSQCSLQSWQLLAMYFSWLSKPYNAGFTIWKEKGGN